MKKLIVEKSIEINASAQKVWEMLTNPTFNKQWIEQFWPNFGALESNWEIDSAMYWKNADGEIDLVGKIIDITPGKLLRYTFTMPQDIVTLSLTEENKFTVLSVIHGDFAEKPDGEECYLGALAGWDMNLQNIKELAEKI